MTAHSVALARASFHLDPAAPPPPPLSTGYPDLDSALGTGGYPPGHMIEIFGDPGSGRTSLALQALRQADRLGHPSLLIATAGSPAPLDLAILDTPRNVHFACIVDGATALTTAIDFFAVPRAVVVIDCFSGLDIDDWGRTCHLVRTLARAARRANGVPLLTNSRHHSGTAAASWGLTALAGAAHIRIALTARQHRTVVEVHRTPAMTTGRHISIPW